ncbi:putative ABC-like lipid transport protein [Encephalitozoon hellem ATCC 50504]|uniref:Sterolin-1 n=1 Tax=Encephalitozoon hellem TaxID=27973 RepID=A0A9Q9CEH3_ENCHE|nr:putative ABC-like lipid transport protein [Encephalitozoon hellem ATCC 50504]AFM99396.1 putative ABC-like lipid transport protein [Encephalitozoon hellem ATCC 50504]UTX44404.1 sterolin-1 [Encephalitozoon hellem]|eukprot:XP_003888377.1 putative ABC-like lipid transport protein [Encephalitozoon hellem ATCC 50504]
MKDHIIDLKKVVLEVPNQDNSSSKKHKRLIKGLDAEFVSGKLYAFMGASGSSKTTTMEAIAGMIPYGSKSSGEILIDNSERSDNKWWEMESSYGRQNEYIINELTVEEFIYYTTSFCLPHESKKNIKRVMDEVLDNVLGLKHVRNNRMTKLSGGEKKRVNIATTFTKMLLLEGKLKVALLDEPTSELDSGLAVKVIRFLKRYAERNNAIVLVTVHQPGPELYSTFDNLLFMDKGRKIYAGPANGFMKYLNSKGIYNPKGPETDREFLFNLFTSGSEEAEQYKEEIKKIRSEAKEEASVDDKLKVDDDTKVDFVPNFSVVLSLVKRQFLIDFRSYVYLIYLITCAVLVIPVLLKKPPFLAFVAVIGSLGHFSGIFSNGMLDTSRKYIQEETNRGMYNTATVWVSAVVIEALHAVIKMGIFIGLMYAFNAFGLLKTANIPLPKFTPSIFMHGILFLFMGSISNLYKCLVDPGTGTGTALLIACMSFKAFILALSKSNHILHFVNFLFKKYLNFAIISDDWKLPSPISSFLDFLIRLFYPELVVRSKLGIIAKSDVGFPVDYKLGNLQFVMFLITSFISLSLISIIFLDRSFTPSRRLKLSENKAAKPRMKPLTQGSWLKRILVIVAVVLVISAFACILMSGINTTGDLLSDFEVDQ